MLRHHTVTSVTTCQTQCCVPHTRKAGVFFSSALLGTLRWELHADEPAHFVVTTCAGMIDMGSQFIENPALLLGEIRGRLRFIQRTGEDHYFNDGGNALEDGESDEGGSSQ